MISLIDLNDESSASMYERIANAIRRRIHDGTLAPQDRLPSKAALAQTLGVNTLTVGRSYDVLQRQGIVELKQGSGTYVHPLALDRLAELRNTCFSTVHFVIGAKDLTGFNHDWLKIVTDILQGMNDILGQQTDRIRFAESFTHSGLGPIADDAAVVYWYAREADASLLHELQQRNIPVLAVWNMDCDLTLPRICQKPHQSVAQACQHLIQCGYRKIGYIGDLGNPLSPKFFEFTNTLFNAGLDYEVRHVGESRVVDLGATFEVVLKMVKAGDLPEAFFIDTDHKAIDAIAALKHAGLSVPEDIGIVSYNDFPEAARFCIPLTTVRPPRREIGQAAARMLLDWAKDNKPLENLLLPSSLVLRQSTRQLTPTGKRKTASSVRK